VDRGVRAHAGATASANSAGAVAADGVEIAAGDRSCTSLPPTADYAAIGPFADARMFENVGPNDNYRLFRPDASLGRDGFKHPLATWAGALGSTPDEYQRTLTLIASHGFVIIACNDVVPERQCLSDGLDWLVEQNTGTSELQGALDTTREVAIGHSLGGGSAIDASDRPNIRATISLHGLAPRDSKAFAEMHGSLLLVTSSGDASSENDVTSTYENSRVPTLYASLDDTSVGHRYVLDDDAVSCRILRVLGGCGNADLERAPAIAWLRYWVCGDQAAKRYFFGDDCVLCTAPWLMQRKLGPQ
jgi:hypothetical protein